MDALVNKDPRDEKKVFVTGAPGRGGGGLLYNSDEDAGRLALLCKLQILVSLRVFGMESQYICQFRYHLVLCIKKFTKNAPRPSTQKFPSNSLSLSYTHIGPP